ncbi:hypothetical protein [Bacillus sp. FSL K6-0067]
MSKATLHGNGLYPSGVAFVQYGSSQYKVHNSKGKTYYVTAKPMCM